jgi:hypothetical protein
MKSAPLSKLFRAIVGLGLAAAACGGQEIAHNLDAGPDPHPDGAAAQDANGYGDALTQYDAGTGFPSPDSAPSVDAAADVAADVGMEEWHPVPIV